MSLTTHLFGARSNSKSGTVVIKDLDHLPVGDLSNSSRRRRTSSLKTCLITCFFLYQVLCAGLLLFLLVRQIQMEEQLTDIQRNMTTAMSRLEAADQISAGNPGASIDRKDFRQAEDQRTATDDFEQKPSNGEDRRRRRRKSMPDTPNPDTTSSSTRDRTGDRTDNSKSKSGTPAARQTKQWRKANRIKLLRDKVNFLGGKLDSYKDVFSHPSAHFVLPEKAPVGWHQTSSEVALKWNVAGSHNGLFETEDSSHFIVRSSGIYFVYLQISYNGQTRPANPTCSHQVMLENHSYPSRKKPILYGSSTQYKLGQMIMLTPHGSEVRAIDTVSQMGIFHLMVGDRLHVRPDDFSTDCLVSTLEDKTFFGSFRLQSSWSESV